MEASNCLQGMNNDNIEKQYIKSATDWTIGKRNIFERD